MRAVPGANGAVRDIFEERRRTAYLEADRRREKLHEAIPELRAIDKRLSDTGILIMDEVAKGRAGLEERIAAIKDENRALIEKRGRILRENGFPEDYSDPKFSCPICRDTGYSGDSMCRCMKKEFARLALEASGLGPLVKKQSFESYDLSYFSPENRERAKRNLEICEAYADTFGKGEAENLLFIGATGLGKTHLSTSIAKRVIENGAWVTYVSSQSMISDFASLKYGLANYEDSEETAKYFDSDLLIIDDLGAEIPGQFGVSVIYNVINTRLCRDKAMIISTNLDPTELRRAYSDRITSRLFGNFSPLLFEGSDNRMNIKAKKNSEGLK